MTHFRFEQGQYILTQGRRYRLGETLPSGEIEVQAIDSRQFMLLERRELEKRYENGSLEFLHASAATVPQLDMPGESRPTDIEELPQKLQQEIRRRHNYMQAVESHELISWQPKHVRPLIESVSTQLGDENPPGVSTLWRWHKAFKEADKDIMALMPHHEKRGNKERKLPKSVIQIIKDVIYEHYLTRTRQSAVDIHHYIINRIDQFNKQHDADRQLKHPSLSTIYNEINKLDPYEVCKARFGKNAADREYGSVGKGPRPTRAFERFEVDHTKLDIFVIDEKSHLPIGRPWLTAIIDKYSGVVAGVHIGFTPPSYVSVMKCLRQAITPKENLLDQYPEIDHDWPVYGIPQTLVTDNGKEFLSQSFEDALHMLGINLGTTPVKQPRFKGSIERFLGDMNQNLLQSQPGTTFSSIIDRNDYDPSKHAVLDLSTLRLVVYKWICDYYHQKEHKGKCDIPIRRFLDSIADDPPVIPREIGQMDALMGRKETRCIHHYGIQINNLIYNAKSLEGIKKRLGNKPVPIRVDEENLGILYVYDEFNRHYIRVPCTNPDYANDLTLWQHQVIQKYSRNYINKHINPSSLAKAKADIQKIVDDASDKSTKTSMRRARWNRLDANQAKIKNHDKAASDIHLINDKNSVQTNQIANPFEESDFDTHHDSHESGDGCSNYTTG